VRDTYRPGTMASKLLYPQDLQAGRSVLHCVLWYLANGGWFKQTLSLVLD